MANIIEMEESFVIEDDFKNILEKIEQEKFKFVDENVEEDTYYTDPEEIFVNAVGSALLFSLSIKSPFFSIKPPSTIPYI